MIRRAAVLLALARAALPWPAAAAGDCANAKTQLDLNECAAADLVRADDELNATWREVMSALAGRPEAIRTLRASQRLWVRLRDADMQALYPLEAGEDLRVQYGSIQPMEAALEKSALTRARTEWLRRHFLATDIH